MTDNTQPEALRLAKALEYCDASVARQAINELRRQHARIAELEAQLEAIGAGGVSGPLMARAADHFPGVTKMVARWYMVDKDGMATLCTGREDAEKEAKDANMAWPHRAPHRAVQFVEVGTSAADYGHGPQSKTVQEAARHVGKWLNERPNRPLDLRDVAMLSAHAQVTASLLEDAARYRFLAGQCRSTSEHWGGRWSIIVDGPAPKSHGSEKDIDEAVDAARKQGANHD